MVEGMWCFCYMLRHIHRTIVYEIHTPPAGFTHYKCECDAAFNRRWKQYKFFYKMEQVTHKHLDWTHGTHKLSRGLPHRVDPLDDFLLYWEDWEEGGEREREIIFHSMCLVGKIKKWEVGKFVYLSFI